MANSRVSTKDHDAVRVDILPGAEYEIIEWRRLHRVPPHLRQDNKHIYDPVVLSLGPYHHLQIPEIDEFKEEVYSQMLDAVGNKVMDMFRQKIRKKICDIRNFYRGVTEAQYNDEALTDMMVRDACFIVYCMEMAAGDHSKGVEVIHYLGLSVYSFMLGDLFLLDNQVPLCVINLLIRLKYVDHKDKGEEFHLKKIKKDKGEELLCKFLSHANFGDERLKKLPWKANQRPPLHLLEARRAVLVEEESSIAITTTTGILKSKGPPGNSQINSVFERVNSPFRSVTDLKAKGIRFRPSSFCLKDIQFNSYGILHLPILFVTNNIKVFFSNVIAFEMSPESEVDSVVLSYISFMKSLIQRPEDVKELREKGILFSRLGNEEVVNIFKEIDAYGIDENIFVQVKMRINDHCTSKATTWMAELIHSKFRNPWTAMALFAAIFLLCLTFLQTFYTIRPSD